jgi:glycosyltransferase involved in cell wall biosynthesis
MAFMNEPYVTIHVVAWNEEHIMEFFVQHYRRMFPNCIVKVFDNGSTDKTVEIAQSLGCEIHYFESEEGPNIFDDRANVKVKNQEWKDAETDWILCSDCDELAQITQEELQKEEEQGNTIIDFQGWQMINDDAAIDLKSMRHGHQDNAYSKNVLFNKRHIKEMNYTHGAHEIKPEGNVVFSRIYTLNHYKFISKSFSYRRRDAYNLRWPKWNEEVLWKDDVVNRGYPDKYIEDMYKKHLVEVEVK